MMDEEEWRDVPGWEGLYQVSNLGQVLSLLPSPHVLRPGLVRGYRHARFKRGERDAPIRVARVVAACFLGPPPSKRHQVNHKDGNKQNDAVDNLEWLTPRQNIHHARRLGLLRHEALRGESNPRSKLSHQQVDAIRAVAGQVSISRLARLCGVSRSTIRGILNGRLWAPEAVGG